MGEVHVWELPLDVPRTVLDRLERLISAEEAARAARFAFARDRDRYRAAHGLLRLALAGYLARARKKSSLREARGGSPGWYIPGACASTCLTPAPSALQP